LLSLLADEYVDPKIIAQIRLHIPDVDFLHVRDVGLNQTPDTTILEWAAANDRIVVTHDKSTMRKFAEDRVDAGLPMPGLFVLHDNLSPGAKVRGLIRAWVNPTGQRIRH
jgi:predicted nuclease of predicted toxin-antitoxin system